MGPEGKSSAGEISPASRMYDANFDDNQNRWVYGPSAGLGVGVLLECRWEGVRTGFLDDGRYRGSTPDRRWAFWAPLWLNGRFMTNARNGAGYGKFGAVTFGLGRLSLARLISTLSPYILRQAFCVRWHQGNMKPPGAISTMAGAISDSSSLFFLSTPG